MARSQESFQKKEVRNKKEKKRKEKAKRREARKSQEKSGNLDDMIAYVDENGVISDTPPDPTKKSEVKAEDIEIGVPKRSDEEEDPIRIGVVTYYNDEKAFGFIRDSETKESVFFHINNCIDEIIMGNQVEFEVEMGPKGPAAASVKLKK